MRARHFFLTGLAVVALLLLSSLAVYYRNRALHFEREWARVVALPAPAEGAATPRDPAAVYRNADPQQPETNNSAVDEPSSDEPPSDVEVAQQAAITAQMREDMERRREESEVRRLYARQQVADSMRRATNYFAHRNTSRLDPAQQEEFNRMVAVLNETVALKELAAAENVSRDKPRGGSIIKSNIVVLASMLENERRQEYFDLALAMGHSEAESAAFAGCIDQIVSNTSINVIFPDAMRRGMLRGER
jgi:hypothetical protein